MVATNDSHENGSFVNYMRGRLFVKNWTLRMLIRTSFGVQDSQIVGGPEWMNVDRFNIEAKGDVGNSPALPVAHAGDPSRLQLMLQSLLADHFKLIVHRETQEADVYALTLLNADGRLGPGLRHSDLDCEALAVQGAPKQLSDANPAEPLRFVARRRIAHHRRSSPVSIGELVVNDGWQTSGRSNRPDGQLRCSSGVDAGSKLTGGVAR
jgi:uncharacterized protein (TIGR03435 family)